MRLVTIDWMDGSMNVVDRVDHEWMCEYDVLESIKCDMRAKKQKHWKKKDRPRTIGAIKEEPRRFHNLHHSLVTSVYPLHQPA